MHLHDILPILLVAEVDLLFSERGDMQDMLIVLKTALMVPSVPEAVAEKLMEQNLDLEMVEKVEMELFDLFDKIPI